MSFDYDIFISYGHVDDEDPAGDVKGWVDLLVERLPSVVAGYLGYKPRIWRDERSLRGNDLLSGAIGEGVSRSLLLVPIVSPRYVLSDWCRTELETFCAAQAPVAAAGVEAFRSRVFKVVKTPLLLAHLRDKEPVQLREMIGYPFYEMEGDMPREFSPDVVPSKDQRYWDALRRLAWDISNMLVALKTEPGSPQTGTAAPANVNAPAGAAAQATTAAQSSVADAAARDASTAVAPSARDAAPVAPVMVATPAALAPNGAGASKLVYLAEATSDLARERDAVRDELRQRGHTVLPEQRLPLDSKDALAEAVRRDLARSCLSVHLVGARYGSTPEDDARSVVCMQIELAAERGAADSSFQRLLWMPPGLSTPALEVTDERQKTFVAGLQNRVAAGAELLQMTVEDLKTRVVEKLTSAARGAARGAARSKLKQVYLICENRDRDLIRPIKEYLFKENFEVITWLDEGAGEKLMDYHRKNLRECDAALIFFGSGDEPWVRKNLEDLEKAYGYGREDDWNASAVYVGSPPNDQKEDFLTHMVPYVIRNFSSFDPADLSDFVAALRSAEGDRP
ncbi:MAG TPA: DUF4062 domain-containing protein [Pyrinomonadaceae bacterium]|nr:DUF4062 domain-containing protein [Pyrinomonadaceae bacterium]